MAAALTMLAELAGPVRNGVRAAIAIVGDMLELGDFAEQAHVEVGQLIDELDLGVIALGAWRDTVARHAGHVLTVTDDPVIAAQRALAGSKPGNWLLLKASRGMRLERVLTAMQELAPTFASELG